VPDITALTVLKPDPSYKKLNAEVPVTVIPLASIRKPVLPFHSNSLSAPNCVPGVDDKVCPS
jgi:hypothetical protein